MRRGWIKASAGHSSQQSDLQSRPGAPCAYRTFVQPFLKRRRSNDQICYHRSRPAPARSRSSLLGGTAAFAAPVTDATVAFLMPDQASTRYEEHDYPGFAAEMKKLCPDCKVIYQNADADASRQQQQFNSVISQGAKVIVLDPVDSTAAASLVKLAQSQGVKVIAYDRPIPTAPADFYVSFDNEGIGKAIADSLVEHLKALKVEPAERRRAADQRLADRRGRRPDQEGHPCRPRQQRLQDPGRVRHAGMGAAEGAAMGERPDHPLRRQDPRRRRRQ